VQRARFGIDYDDGGHYSAVLDAAGHADLTHTPDGSGRVRFGADARPWQAKADDVNPAHRPQWSNRDFASSASKNKSEAS
jgi:hypothetical protein